MKLLNKLKDRHTILFIILIVMFLSLSFRLASLTIVRGDALRERANAKRVREITIKAPRGEIRDRYGRLLAGNKPSFIVQIMKDEINRLNKDERNKALLKLVTILEEEGERYNDEFPIKLNTFKYKTDELYKSKEYTPEDEVIERIASNGLLNNFLDLYYKEGDYTFLAGERTRLVLRKEGIDIPINISLNSEGNVLYSFIEGEDSDKFFKENNVSPTLSPKEILIDFINKDENLITKLLSHPVMRKLAFEMLKSKGLDYDLKLEDFTFTFDEEYIKMKTRLMKLELEQKYMENDNYISFSTSAKEDFINLALHEPVIIQLLTSINTKDEDNKDYIIPGEMLIKRLEEKLGKSPIKIDVNIDEETVNYKFVSKKEKEEFLDKHEIIGDILPIDALILLSTKERVIGDIITHDDLKYKVQGLILDLLTSPGISVTNLEYVYNNEKLEWLNSNKIDEESTPSEAFEALVDLYSVDDGLNKYDKRLILLMLEQLKKQGYRGYEPINMASDLENITVAKIEENKMSLKGIEVEIEPIRYYPMGESAAHILGYLGKISSKSEIEKYLTDRKDYLRSDMIGKTGVELAFEEYLHGDNGSKRVEIDAFGNTVKTLEQTKAIPGDNIHLTIDAKLQKVAEDSLKHALEEIQVAGEFKSEWGNYNYNPEKGGRLLKNATSGATVAIDVKTGEVLAIANYPSYDPNLFLPAGISSADWKSLEPEFPEDPLAPRPLYNIALRTTVQPGSTFKMLTGLAGLESGIDPNYNIYDYGYVDLGASRPACWLWNQSRGSHGNENLYDAIRDSCNYYFYTLMLGYVDKTNKSIPGKVEIDDLLDMARQFGLDEKTGVEIPEEKSGSVPNKESKASYANYDFKRFLKYNYNRDLIKMEGKLSDDEIDLLVNNAFIWANSDEKLSAGGIKKKIEELDLNLDIDIPLEYPIYDSEIEDYRIKQLSLLDYVAYTYINEATFGIGSWLNISIGQGENSYTPIQMANYIATLANGGYKHDLTVINKVTNYNNKEATFVPERTSERIELSNYSYLDEVNKGMKMVTEPGGTAYSAFKNFPIEVAAKTGTAQKSGTNPVTGESYDNFAWFVSFAPYDDPEIAVATVIFQGGHGGFAAPINKEITAQYLGLNNESDNKINFNNKLVR